jgi:hypothetical protein
MLGFVAGEAGPDGNAERLRRSLRAAVTKGDGLISLSVDGQSREAAATYARTAVDLLGRAHQRISEPTLARLQAQFAATDADISSLVRERARLLESTRGLSAAGGGSRFSESVVLGDLLEKKDKELLRLRDRRILIEEQLSAQITYPTSILTDVFVPDKKYFPRRSIFGLIGSGLMVFIAVCWSIVRATRK